MTDRRIAAALRVLAQAATADRLETTDGTVRLRFLDVESRQAARLTAALTDVATEEWAGENGSRYRTTTGLLLAMPVEVTELLPLEPKGESQ